MANITKLERPKGTKDIFGQDMKILEYVEDKIRKVTSTRNMKQLRTPVFEDTKLFKRSIGDETDVVNKEMYTFLDKGDRSITLRPELTACAVRAYIENGYASMPSPLKMWYVGNMYRYEKMQKGRYREFSQFGVEIFGSNDVTADVEAILTAYEVFKELNILDKITLEINSIGCKECRKEYLNKLKDYLKDEITNMCDDCKVRYEKNPMRIIDCKEEYCKTVNKNVPLITDCLCEECNNDFETLKELLTALNINYEINKTIVRGLDYYNKTVFEFTSKDLNLAVGGGGRYDTLIETLGGAKTPAVGFALGIDRIILLLKELTDINIEESVDLYFIVTSKDMFKKAFNIITDMRNLGYIVDTDISSRSFNAQFKYANKINAKNICIIDEETLTTGNCTIKNMQTSNQEICKLEMSSIIEKIK